MWVGRRRMNRLAKQTGPPRLPPESPAVTVLVPAKDEGPRVRDALDSVLAQDYPNFTALAIDDRSADDTGAVLDAAAAASGGRLGALHVTDLPQGWLGKCHALDVGARHADGAWLLFVDSDVRLLRPDALSAALALAVSRKYDAVSLMTRLECHTPLERLVLPLAAGAWSVMHTISRTNEDNSTTSAYANGQFLLCRRGAYDAVGGHAAVRDRITEDVELFRLLKAAGFRVRLLLGSRYASTRMHATLRQMLRGWGRIYSGTSRRRPWRILGAIAFVLVCGFSAYAALAWGAARWAGNDPSAGRWLAAAGGHLVVMTLVLAGIYADSGNPRRHALLFPVGGAILLALFAFALRWCATGRIEWRGTTFDQNRAPASEAPVSHLSPRGERSPRSGG
jgi:glycosyltransferase involved in cell wall biosynthesis